MASSRLRKTVLGALIFGGSTAAAVWMLTDQKVDKFLLLNSLAISYLHFIMVIFRRVMSVLLTS